MSLDQSKYPSELTFTSVTVSVTPSASFSTAFDTANKEVTLTATTSIAAGTVVTVTLGTATTPSGTGSLSHFAITGSNGDEVSDSVNSGSRPTPLVIAAGKELSLCIDTWCEGDKS